MQGPELVSKNGENMRVKSIILTVVAIVGSLLMVNAIMKLIPSLGMIEMFVGGLVIVLIAMALGAKKFN